ncbi:MAG: ketoacyl-ACP synthase III, partial [Pedobacter sp.]
MSNKTNLYSVITGTGSYIPENIISGDSFLDAVFYDNGTIIDKDITEIIKKFSEITEINER